MYLHCSNNAITYLNAAKSLKITSTTNLKIQNLPRISSANLPASLPASQPTSQPAVRPSCARCMALEFLHKEDNHVAFTKLLF